MTVDALSLVLCSSQLNESHLSSPTDALYRQQTEKGSSDTRAWLLWCWQSYSRSVGTAGHLLTEWKAKNSHVLWLPEQPFKGFHRARSHRKLVMSEKGVQTLRINLDAGSMWKQVKRCCLCGFCFCLTEKPGSS